MKIILLNLLFGLLCALLLIVFFLQPFGLSEWWAISAFHISLFGNTYSLFGGFSSCKEEGLFLTGGNVYSLIGLIQVANAGAYSFLGLTLIQVAGDEACSFFGISIYQKAQSTLHCVGVSVYQEGDEPRSFMSINFYQNAIGPSADAYQTLCIGFYQNSDMDIENKLSVIVYSKALWEENKRN